MNIQDIIRLPDPRKSVKAELREVVRDVKEKPHVFVRVRLTGWHFPRQAPEPFMVIGDAVSKFVILDPDGNAAEGFFDTMVPSGRMVSFGYGKIISWDFPVTINPRNVRLLERSRLPKGFVDLGGRD